MRAARVRPQLAALLSCLVALAPSLAAAQAPTPAAAEAWIDGLLAEIRATGATRAERGAVTADGRGAFSVAGITVAVPGGVQIALARLSGEGVETGARFSAQRLRIEGFAVTADVLRAEAPAIEAERLDLPALTPAALFGRSDAGLVATLRELDLARLAMASLTVRGGRGESALQATLRNVLVEEVRRGLAARVDYGPTEFSGRDATGTTITGTLGAISAEQVDLAVNASILAPQPGGTREPRTAYARASFAGGTIEIGGGIKLTLGRMEAVDARLRAPRTGYLELLRLVLAMQGQASPASPEMLQRLVTVMQDYLDLSEVERFSLAESRLETPQGNFSVGGFEGSEIGSARFGRLAVSGVAFESPQASFSIGRFALSEVDYTDTLRVLFDAMAAGRTGPDPALFEGRLPRIGGIELREISLDVPSQGEVSLDSATFAMGRWRGFVPDLLRLTIGGLSIPTALIEAGGAIAPPRPSELGYDSLDLSAEVQIRIDETARTATLAPSRVAVDELGSVSLELTLGDVDTGRFGFAGLSDPLPLLQQTTVRELRLRIENAGIVDRVAGWHERAQRMPAAQVRAMLVQGIATLAEVLIQDPAQKERARAALQAFAREQRSLTLVVTPRSRLSLLDLVAATQGSGPPLQLLGELDLALTAND